MAKVMSLRVEAGLENDTLPYYSSAHMEQISLIPEDSQVPEWHTVQPLPGVPTVFSKYLCLDEFSDSLKSMEDVSAVVETSEFSPCDCIGKSLKISQTGCQCPHMQITANILFLQSLQARLKHLELLEKKDKESKQNLFVDDIPIIRDHLREYTRNFLKETDCGSNSCHLKTSLLDFFKSLEGESKLKVSNEVPLCTKCDPGKLCVNLSFASNIILCALKILAYSFSLSMSVLASMVDSCLDILSGLVLYIYSRLARSGAEKLERQNPAHFNKQSVMYPIGKRRYETLGVLSFACIMGTFAVTLIYESILQTVALVRQAPDNPAKFDLLQIIIIGFTIVLKLFLCLLCNFVGKRSKTLSDACIAYRDDHRNDVLSNSVGFVSAFIGSRFNGHDGTLNLSYIDPIGSILLCLYILINWTLSARDQIRSMVGRSLELQPQARLVLHAMHFDPSIERINEVLAYQCGRESTVEVTICVPDQMYVCSCHTIVHALQNHIQKLDFVERCFVHVESLNCYSSLTMQA